MTEPLYIDPDRRDFADSTGLFVRAKDASGKSHSVDIAVLTKDSLQQWLRSRGGDNPWAENVVAILLGHGHFED